MPDADLIEHTTGSTELFKGHFLHAFRDTVRLPDGGAATREYVVHPGAVMIVPLLDDGRLVLERQYRYPVRQVMVEFPAGKLDPGESFAEAARRELFEETGLVADPGPEIGRREVEFVTLEGVLVSAEEGWFRFDTDAFEVDPAGHTELERQVMRGWRWFARGEIADHPEQIWPEDLVALLEQTDPADAR